MPEQRALALADRLAQSYFKPNSPILLAIKQALPTAIVPAESLVRAALSTIRNSPALQRCTPYSIICTVTEAAQAGLSLDVNLGQAYMVPFKGVAKLMYGYRGMIVLARRSGEIGDVVGELRYERDKWALRLGSRRELVHEPLDAPVAKRGKVLGAYAVAMFSDGRAPMFEYMDRSQIDAIRDAVLKRKKTDGPSPWETNEDEMQRKTPIRRLAKRMPQSPGMAPLVRAALRDEYREAGAIDIPAIETDPELSGVLDAVHDAGVAGEGIPTAAAVKATPPKAEPLTEHQLMTIRTLCEDWKLAPAQLVGAMAELGCKSLNTFTQDKYQALLAALQRLALK